MPLLPNPESTSTATREIVRRYHTHGPSPGQCGSLHMQEIAAPLSAVWSLVRSFDQPQSFKLFVKDCAVRAGDGGVGSIREVRLVSGLPATFSTERLDALDDDRHLISISTIGGDLRLANYQSTTTLHESGGGRGTVVLESYVVDVPTGNTREETCIFADTILGCNLRSLARISEGMARL